MVTTMADLAQAIHETRRAKRMTKVAAAEACGVSRFTFQMWERGSVTPQAHRYEELAAFLDREPTEMLAELKQLNNQLQYTRDDV